MAVAEEVLCRWRENGEGALDLNLSGGGGVWYFMFELPPNCTCKARSLLLHGKMKILYHTTLKHLDDTSPLFSQYVPSRLK